MQFFNIHLALSWNSGAISYLGRGLKPYRCIHLDCENLNAYFLACWVIAETVTFCWNSPNLENRQSTAFWEFSLAMGTFKWKPRIASYRAITWFWKSRMIKIYPAYYRLLRANTAFFQLLVKIFKITVQ